jgi:hypothetical protein
MVTGVPILHSWRLKGLITTSWHEVGLGMLCFAEIICYVFNFQWNIFFEWLCFYLFCFHWNIFEQQLFYFSVFNGMLYLNVGGDASTSAVALPPAKTGPATTGVVDSSFYEAISWPQRYTWTMTSTRLASWRCWWRCRSRPQAVRARSRPVGGTAMSCPRGPGTSSIDALKLCS